MSFESTAAFGTALLTCVLFMHSGPALADQVKPAAAAGTASWYGNPFHGRLTASGERYNMNELTAAHRSLPFGSKVRVTNRNNNQSVVVRINDRGPFAGKRLIDLSRAAASALKMMSSGVAPVKLELLGSAGS